MNEKKQNHVGRPTNEELNERKKKKTLKIVISVLIVMVLGGGIFLLFNRELLEPGVITGDSSTYYTNNMTIIYLKNKYADVVKCEDSTFRLMKGRNSKSSNPDYYCYRYSGLKKYIKTPVVLRINYFSHLHSNDLKELGTGIKYHSIGSFSSSVGSAITALNSYTKYEQTVAPADAFNFLKKITGRNDVTSDNGIGDSYLNYFFPGANSPHYGNIVNNMYFKNCIGSNCEQTKYSVMTDLVSTRTLDNPVSELLDKLSSANCVGIAPLNTKEKCVGTAKKFCNSSFMTKYVTFYYAGNLTKGKYVYVNDPQNSNYFNVITNINDLWDSTKHDGNTNKVLHLLCRR